MSDDECHCKRQTEERRGEERRGQVRPEQGQE